MKKLVLSVILLISTMVLLCGCGAEEVDWDDFFNEYYKECIQLCEVCAEWSKMCGNSNYDVNICIEKRWNYSTSNDKCTDANKNIELLLLQGKCQDDSLWNCTDFN